MVQQFQNKVKIFHKQLHLQQLKEARIRKKETKTLSLVMIQLMIPQLQKHDSIHFQHRTLEKFATYYHDPQIRQCWTEEEWQQWHRDLIFIRRQLPPMEGIALAA